MQWCGQLTGLSFRRLKVFYQQIKLMCHAVCTVQVNEEVPQSVRRELLDLWPRQQRAAEERQLSIGDMCNAYAHYINLHIALQRAVETQADLGKRAVLYNLGVGAERRCRELHAAFCSVVTLPLMSAFFRTLNSSEGEACDMDDISDILDNDLGNVDEDDCVEPGDCVQDAAS